MQKLTLNQNSVKTNFYQINICNWEMFFLEISMVTGRLQTSINHLFKTWILLFKKVIFTEFVGKSVLVNQEFSGQLLDKFPTFLARSSKKVQFRTFNKSQSFSQQLWRKTFFLVNNSMKKDIKKQYKIHVSRVTCLFLRTEIKRQWEKEGLRFREDKKPDWH